MVQSNLLFLKQWKSKHTFSCLNEFKMHWKSNRKKKKEQLEKSCKRHGITLSVTGTCIQYCPIFLLQKGCSTPKPRRQKFLAQVRRKRAPSRDLHSLGGWSQVTAGRAGPTQDTGKAAILPISTESVELALQAGALTLVKSLQEFLSSLLAQALRTTHSPFPLAL